MKAKGHMKINKTQGQVKMKKLKEMKTKKKQSPGQQKTTVSKKKIAEMSIDDMFSMVQDDNIVMSDEEIPRASKQGKKTGKKKKLKQDKKLNKMEEESDDFEEDEDMVGVGKLSRKEYLKQLKQTDPDFYATMMQSGELMDLRSSDDEEEESSEEEEEDPERGGAIFQPPAKLEVDSDESDAEEEGLQKRGHNVITAAMVAKWEEELSGSQPLSTFLEVTQAFHAAIDSLGSRNENEAEVSSKYKVEGPQIFNAIIRICLRNVPSVLEKILNLKSSTDDPTKAKKWTKYRNFIKTYLRLLVKLTECVAEPSVAEVVLNRGVLPLLPYYAANIVTSRLLFKRLIKLWATSEKRVRVIAFICIFRLSRSLKGQFLEWVLKRLYLAYVQNSRFTSPSTWGLIDFMRISLVELYALDQPLAYKHAFVYIRQMAIHLRNAITIMKKEQVQLVYNWQYIHCIHLWAELLGKTHPSPALQPIIYPLTQVAIGTMKLQATPSFYPLVFQVCGILTELSRHTGTFIPVLPFLLQVINKAPLDKKHKKASIRPYDWMCMLRLSRAEMTESAFKDGVVDQVYNGLINYLSVESGSIAFPELVVPANLQLKAFLKKCKVPNYTKKIKQLLDKINENQKFIESKRSEISFGIADSKAVQHWEIAIRQSGTPLDKHYQNWKKVWEKDQLRRISNRVEMDDYNLPTIRKKELLEKQKAKDKHEFKELFASDDDDDEDDDDDDGGLNDETRFLTKDKRPKLTAKQNGKIEDKEEKDSDDDDDDADDEDDSESEKDEADSDEDENEIDKTIEPPAKKNKKNKVEVEDNPVVSDDEVDADDDVVREMNFSDMESDEEVDDYGEVSDDE